MPDRLFRLYQRKRVININTNVVAAGLLSTFIVAALLWLIRHPLDQHWPKWAFTAFSLVADLILDVAIFTGLHWLANHYRPKTGPLAAIPDSAEARHLSIPPPHVAKDTAQLQLERAVISPAYYAIAGGGTYLCQYLGLGPYWAVLIAYPAGLVVTRTIHTLWGLKSGTYHDHHIAEKRRRIETKRARRAAKRQSASPNSPP